jgi:hypothetical protein
MLDDGVKGAGKEESEVRVADISIHLLESLERPTEPRNGQGPRHNAVTAHRPGGFSGQVAKVTPEPVIEPAGGD